MVVRPRRLMPRPPLWAQWVMSLLCAAGALTALVLFVSANDHNYSVATLDPAAVQRANREAELLTAQDQQPHLVRLRSALSPRLALVRVIRQDMDRRIASGAVAGTLQRAFCRPAGGGASAPAFSCLATAASVNYMYVGVVHIAARELVWCRHDEPPVPGVPVPLSPLCTR
ncbi:MAG TPA: hypothetical protein VKV27_08095 [Solirubrobacteraceae bacterium]|nr:hypothetical protein [Solirubrobacteraceae bacterium]